MKLLNKNYNLKMIFAVFLMVSSGALLSKYFVIAFIILITALLLFGIKEFIEEIKGD